MPPAAPSIQPAPATLAARRQTAYRAILVGSALLLAGGLMLAVVLGSAHIPVERAWRIVAEPLAPSLTTDDIRDVDRRIVWQVRVPRAILAALIGAMLAVAGAQMQGLFRNPLADTGVLGTAQGAALGCVVAIAAGLAARSVVYLPVCAFVGAFAALGIIVAFASRRGRVPVGLLLLVGIALNFLLSAGISLVLSLSFKRYDVAAQLMSWLMGGLDGKGWSHVAMAVPCLVAAYGLGAWFARDLDLLLEGDETARALGVDVDRVQRSLMLSVSLLSAAAVATSGIIGFVGLVVPHMLRPLIGPAHARLYPASALTGAWLLVLSDLVARTVHWPEEIQLGIVTASLGAPLFLFLLLRRRQEYAIL